MKILILFIFIFYTAAFASQSELCHDENRVQLSFSNSVKTREAETISVVIWNAHKLDDAQFFPDLVGLSQNADLILLQEALHNDELQNKFAIQIPMDFSFFKSFCTLTNTATGVLTASRFKLENNLALISPDTEPITFTPKVSGYSAIEIPGIGKIHILNTHALNFNMGSAFERQMTQLAEFINSLQGPVIWAGDFNTWSPGRRKQLFSLAQKAGLTPLLPRNDSRFLKLDHFFIRELEPQEIIILDNLKSSDHFPVKLILKRK